MMNLNKGDIVWIDTAPLVASPSKTGRTVMCEVVVPSPEHEQQVYLAPTGQAPLYVFKHWITEPDGFKAKPKR